MVSFPPNVFLFTGCFFPENVFRRKQGASLIYHPVSFKKRVRSMVKRMPLSAAADGQRVWDGHQFRVVRRCPHGRIRKDLCKPCGGAGICEHNRRRNACGECGGPSMCEHKRPRRRCADCGGKDICEHRLVRNYCRECLKTGTGGRLLCPHQKRKVHCRECAPSRLCKHNKQVRQCKHCSEAGLCKHQKDKGNCSECRRESKCRHKKSRCVCMRRARCGVCGSRAYRRLMAVPRWQVHMPAVQGHPRRRRGWRRSQGARATRVFGEGAPAACQPPGESNCVSNHGRPADSGISARACSSEAETAKECRQGAQGAGQVQES